MAGRINPISTPQFDGKDPRALQTWGTQVRDSLNQVVDLANQIKGGDADLTVDTLSASRVTAAAGYRFPVIVASLLSTSIGASTSGLMGSGGTSLVYQVRMPYAGTIVALTARTSNGAYTAGSTVFAVRVNGTVTTNTVTLSSTTQSGTLYLPTPLAFAAGDSLAIQFTTDASYAGTATVTTTASLWVIV
jgi:hypothetical protein